MCKIPYFRVSYVLFIAILTVILNNSCISYWESHSKQNQLTIEDYIYFNNDDLKIFLRFAGDYVFDEKFIKKDFENQKTPLSIYFKKKYFVFANHTNISPFLASSLFIVPNNRFDKGVLNNFVKSISETNYTYYQNTDTTQNTLLRVYPYPEKSSYLVFYCKAMSKRHFYNIKEFDESVFPSLKMGKDYQKYIPKSPFDEANRAFFSYDSSLNYIAPVLLLQKTSEQYKDESHTYTQALLTYTSFLENPDSLKNYLNKWIDNTYYRYNKNIIIDKSKIDFDSKFNNAISLIADTNQVVMLNETHFVPENRFLLLNLLNIFYQKGFRYLAVEAVWENGDTLTKRGYPIISSGFYTREPTMSNMIRKAICLGFTIVNYDDFSGERELKQAENIYNKTIAKDNDAKVLVYAGLGHIHEADSSANRLMMASHFKNISGINPFTIDQLELLPSAHLYSYFRTGIVSKSNFQKGRKAINVDAYIINSLNIYNDYFDNNSKTINVEIELSDNVLSEPRNTILVAYLYNKKEYDLYANKAIPISVRIIKDCTTNLKYKIDSCNKNEHVFLLRNSLNDIIFKKILNL